MTCKNLCSRFKDTIKIASGIKPYTLGYVFCSHCVIYFKTDKIFCPCCGTHLRFNPIVKSDKAEQKYQYNRLWRINHD